MNVLLNRTRLFLHFCVAVQGKESPLEQNEFSRHLFAHSRGARAIIKTLIHQTNLQKNKMNLQITYKTLVFDVLPS